MATSHSRAMKSWHPVKIVLLSGLNTTALNPVVMFQRFVARCSGRRVPEPDVAVLARRRGGLAVRTEGNAPDPSMVFQRSSSEASGGGVPETRVRLQAPDQEGLAIRAKCHGSDAGLVLHGCADGLPRDGVPELGGPVSLAGQDGLAVGARALPRSLFFLQSLPHEVARLRCPRAGRSRCRGVLGPHTVSMVLPSGPNDADQTLLS